MAQCNDPFELLPPFLLSCFVCSSSCCMVVDRLMGGLLRRNLGSRRWSLELNSAASLASSSTASLPSDPMCPATHVNVIIRLGFA